MTTLADLATLLAKNSNLARANQDMKFTGSYMSPSGETFLINEGGGVYDTKGNVSKSLFDTDTGKILNAAGAPTAMKPIWFDPNKPNFSLADTNTLYNPNGTPNSTYNFDSSYNKVNTGSYSTNDYGNTVYNTFGNPIGGGVTDTTYGSTPGAGTTPVTGTSAGITLEDLDKWWEDKNKTTTTTTTDQGLSTLYPRVNWGNYQSGDRGARYFDTNTGNYSMGNLYNTNTTSF